MTAIEKLEAEVEAHRAKNERRKAEAAEQGQLAAKAREEELIRARRSCAGEESDAVEAGGSLGDFISMLQGLKASNPADEELHAWKTWMREELVRSRIPERYRYRMGEWECAAQRKVYGLCKRAMIGCGSVMALIGQRGTGKTTVATQIIIDRVIEDWRAIFIDRTPGYVPRYMPYRKMSDIVARFKLLYADFGGVDGESLIAARDSICRADLLVIDEIHDCDDQKMKHRILTDFIDRRYSRMKDTILISNQDEAEFRSTNSDSIISRIQEHGHIVPCNWTSFRAKSPDMPAPRHGA